MIRQEKSWLRTTYSWVPQGHINRHLDEFCFRLNRSILKDTIFHNLLVRMVQSKLATYKSIIVSN